MIRTDHGAAVANKVARLVVVAPVRHGGQQQFIDSALPPERGTSLAETRAWAVERPSAYRGSFTQAPAHTETGSASGVRADGGCQSGGMNR
jgi:hypothetical protein